MAENSQNDQQCSFGIKKIVDCKIGEGGKQMYKVKWEATWEPAENLSSCQHLIDEFWSFVNKAKSNESVAQQQRKRIRLDSNSQNNGIAGFGAQHMLSEDSKEEVQRLIARTNATQAGNPPNLMTPSDMLNTQQTQMGIPRTPTRQPQSPFTQNPRMPYAQSPNQSFNQQLHSPQPSFGSPSQMNSPSAHGKGFGKSASMKTEDDTVVSSKGGLHNWQEEIAEVVYICKNCKKPLSKHKTTWRRHYASCTKDFQYNCHECGKGFTMKYRLGNHIQVKHGGSGSENLQSGGVTPVVKQEEEFKTKQNSFEMTSQQQIEELKLPGIVEMHSFNKHMKADTFNMAFPY